jgi:hypothetical protein
LYESLDSAEFSSDSHVSREPRDRLRPTRGDDRAEHLPAGARQAKTGDKFADVLMSGYECGSTILTSNLALDDRPKLLSDAVAVTPVLDRLMHRGHLRENIVRKLMLAGFEITAAQQ